MQQQNITFIPETEVRYEVIVPRTGNISPVFVFYLIYSTSAAFSESDVIWYTKILANLLQLLKWLS